MYDEYFKLTKEYVEQYGPDTILFMQCGDFFDMYAYIDKNTGEMTGSRMNEIAEHCSIVVVRKNHLYNGHVLFQAGVNVASIDKYIEMCIDYGYTVPVYIQTGEDCQTTKKKVRKLEAVHSPSTYLSLDMNKNMSSTNNVMCIWMDTHFSTAPRFKDKMIYGVAVLNNYNGQSSMYETIVDKKTLSTAFDELERIVSIYRPKECVWIYNPNAVPMKGADDKYRENLMQFSGLSLVSNPNTKMHWFSTKNTTCTKCSKQRYMQQILNNQFGEECFQHCREFLQYTYATQAFCFLLDFVEQRNGSLIRNIYMPVFHNVSKRMHLANHSLKQLNIISDNSQDGKKNGNVDSVSAFLNKCATGIGRRKFQYVLCHPVFDEEWLEQEYSMMSYILQSRHTIDMLNPVRKTLSQMCDMERICKLIAYGRILPTTMHQWGLSLDRTLQLYTCFETMPEVLSYLCTPDFVRTTQNEVYTNTSTEHSPVIFVNNLRELKSYLDSNIQLSACQTGTSLNNLDYHIIVPGTCKELDELTERYNFFQKQLDVIHEYLEGLMVKGSNATNNPNGKTEYIKRNQPEKSELSLQITKIRSEVLKRQIASEERRDKEAGGDGIVRLNLNVEFAYKDVRCVATRGNSLDITIPYLQQIIKEIFLLKPEVHTATWFRYLRIVREIDASFTNTMDSVNQFIGKLDVLFCKCYAARTYNYNRPIICTESSKSFFEVEKLRHVLIEQFVQNELYVTNDICLGKRHSTESDEEKKTHISNDLLSVDDSLEEKDVDGILLYGTNAVGKTSMMRACGIALILAQAGMFVPCSKFLYKPYRTIFTRILSADNLFKGLSTFAVEMSELRVILNSSDKYSIVLGDELCSGTETESALSIVMTVLEKLHEKEVTMLFATHFHELVDFPELHALSRLQLKHLEVYYDRENDCLVYDRKIKDGPGRHSYGLEVCQSLYLSDDFVDRAYEIRKNHFESHTTTLDMKSTHFNSKKIKGKCEVCGVYSKTNEMHHLDEQNRADSRGYIDGVFHKNHPGNLMTVCQKCHDMFHHGDGPRHTPVVKSPSGLGTNKMKTKVSKASNLFLPPPPIPESGTEISPLTEDDINTLSTKKVLRRKKTTKGFKLMETPI